MQLTQVPLSFDHSSDLWVHVILKRNTELLTYFDINFQ